jgi:hypothetical protein
MSDIKITKKNIFILLAIFCIGLILRLLYFQQITFGYDQARDALEAMDILTGDVKIIGPTTDIRGLFHGPLYWYIISPVYFLFRGSPEPVRLLMIIINLLNVLFIYYFSKKLFKSDLIALIGSFIFAVTFESVQYARWLSNPPPAILTIALFFYGLWLTVNEKYYGLPLMLLSFSMSVNFQFFLMYHIVFIIFALIFIYIKTKGKFLQTVGARPLLYLGALFFFSPFILSELKFKFQGIRSVLAVITNKANTNEPVIQKIIKFYYCLVRNISYNLTAGNQFVAKIILFLLIGFVLYSIFKNYRYKKQILFLTIWLISPVMIYPLERNNSYFLNIGNTYPLVILASLGIYLVIDKLKRMKYPVLAGVLLVIFAANFYLILTRNVKGDYLFSVQDRQIYNNEKEVVDYIYKSSQDEKFGINSVTNPLFINSTWSYLFHYYGKTKYGYMPSWLGYPQDGTFGAEITYEDMGDKKGNLLYLIIEPTPGIPEEYIEAYKHYENVRSKLIEEKRVGNFLIEKRELTEEINFSRDDLMKVIFNKSL